jgi:putative MATE family efflux protein
MIPRKRFGPWSFYRQALAIALPVMLQQLIGSLVSLIDNFMVAGLGDAKMAAVNVANQINFVYFVALFTLCNAGGIYLAQYRGAGDAEGMKQAYRFKVLSALALSSLHFVLCWTVPEPMARLMTAGNAAQDEIVRYAAEYLRVVSFTWFPIAIATAIGSAFREIGRPRIPLAISIAATLVNTFGNWILIYGNLGAPRLEVAGAAVATVIARVVELAAFLVYVRVKPVDFFVPLSRIWRINLKLIGGALSRSGMMVATETTWVLSETVITALYNGRGGADVVAGMAAGWTIANIFFLVFNGIHAATAVIVGGTLGTGDLEAARVKAGWVKSGAFVAGCVVAVLAVLSLAGIPLVFANLSAAARAITGGLVLVIAAYLPVWTLLNSQFAVARAGGDTVLGIWVDVVINLVLFIPGAFLLAFFTPMGPVALFATIKTTDFLKYAVASWHMRKELWLKNLTVRPPDLPA